MRTVDPRLWTDPEFLALSPGAKLLFLCCATGPVGGYPATLRSLTSLDDAGVERALFELADAQASGAPSLYRHVSKHTHPPAVYFIQAGDGLIKIGWTSDVETRLATLQTGSADDLELLALILGAQADERRLHQKFAHLRVRGEWFEPSQEIKDYIRAIERGDVEELA